jgi:Uma2 family endonuclease
MSTVPRRRRPSESGKSGGSPANRVRRGRASYDYGYRDIVKKLPDGRYVSKRIPLTLEDVLHPQFGDVHVLGDPHDDDCHYVKFALKARYIGDESVVVFSDCGIFWDVPGLRHHSPDISVIFGVRQQKDWETFHVKLEGVRPILIIEVTSPKTRVNDVKTKVRQYADAGVVHYVVADVSKRGGRRRLTLIRYRLKDGAYEQMPLDEQARAWLEPVGLWLATKTNPRTRGDRLVLIDPSTNQEIGDYTELNQERESAQARARAAQEQARAAQEQARAALEQARTAEEQARAEANRAEHERHARAQAEARVLELEAQLRRRKKRGK